MKTQSAKEKGSRLERQVAQRIEEVLGDYGVSAKRMLMSGAIAGWKSDIMTNLPVSIECKNQEKINVWDSWDQASNDKGSRMPILIFSRNRNKQPLAIITFEDLLFFMEVAIQSGWVGSIKKPKKHK